MRRFLALHLPRLPTDRLRTLGPAATWNTVGPRRLLVSVDEMAEAVGLRPGQSVATALAISPKLALARSDEPAEAAALRRLALWARRYSPLTATDAPDVVLVDITGVGLFGGEEALRQDAVARLRRAGFAVRAVVAGHAAVPLVRAGAEGVVPPEREGAFIHALPLGVLPGVPAAELAALGLRRVGDLQVLPPATLALRFGQGLLNALERWTGQRPLPVQPLPPPLEIAAMRDFVEPLVTRTALDRALALLLEDVSARCAAAGLGLRRLRLLCWRVDGLVQELTVGTGAPSRDPLHLARLFAGRMEQLEPGLGFERMALEALETERQDAAQASLLGRGATDLAGPLDHLDQRLRLRRLAPAPSHWPEHMAEPVSPHALPAAMPDGWASTHWPVLWLRKPETVGVTPPDGTPARMLWRGQSWRLRVLDGPARLEAPWWHGPGATRDLHWVEISSGARLLLSREAEWRWLLRGHLP
ncbi:Y-family DNA polymerase [Sabulicella glaciei]|uniref:DNA polymerase Y family protein n=1 Tax=Sabulicella glaciei TaxID=2984948 RepID=A0ABT3NTX7_9PROT|nr:DNA polymerase Y family protein [Roseococcus sp. MDT2-1-1]MCW8085616.1 DNA polymerase Y family protein [Roseococcus sp. MDT2-1-1]